MSVKAVAGISAAFVFLSSLLWPLAPLAFKGSLMFVFYFLSWTIFWNAISPVFADNSVWAVLPVAALFNAATYSLITAVVYFVVKNKQTDIVKKVLVTWCGVYFFIVFLVPVFSELP